MMASLSLEAKADLLWHWPFWARPSQLAPDGDWSTWLVLSGRGWGKTEAGAQWVRQKVASGAKQIALVAETQKDLEEVMVPRVLSVTPEHERPTARFRPVRLTWPNGAQALGYNGTEPNQLRGPEFDAAWLDEMAKYRYAQEVWDMLQFTLRRGDNPQVMVTTTPRPIPIVKSLVKAPSTVVTRGTTFDNAANLPDTFLRQIRTLYEGTRRGRQELNAEILDDVPGALWTNAMFNQIDEIEQATRIVVGVDPSGASGADNERADEIGIVVAAELRNNRYAVLEDATCALGPDGWARVVSQMYHKWQADAVIAESNFGGAMVLSVIRNHDRNIPARLVPASRGKHVRAEPISMLYEQGRVDHVKGLSQLEDQMIHMTTSGYIGEGSPDRLDAAVWALTELSGGSGYALEGFL